MLLDACRDNLGSRRLLKRSSAPRARPAVDKVSPAIGDGGGMIIGSATAPGDVAADGEEAITARSRTALLEQLPTQGWSSRR